jgi:hypothetical protein
MILSFQLSFSPIAKLSQSGSITCFTRSEQKLYIIGVLFYFIKTILCGIICVIKLLFTYSSVVVYSLLQFVLDLNSTINSSCSIATFRFGFRYCYREGTIDQPDAFNLPDLLITYAVSAR